MYCKPSRNAEPKRKRQLGINLFPVLVSVPLLALLLIFFGARRRWVLWTLIASAILFIVVYLIRMALLFPSSPPMTVEPDGLIPRLLGWRF